jgi:nitrate reductase beta subunit
LGKDGDSIELRGAGKVKGMNNLFHNPNMPEMNDYYEPWKYDYDHLFEAKQGSGQPTARPVSL